MRKMRRFHQQLTREKCVEILERGTSGVLALKGEEDYPYAVPMSYVYHEGKLFFHSALEGHKIDAIRSWNKASFCVIDRDCVVSQEYTTYFSSAIAFGNIRILQEEDRKRKAIEILAEKYSPMEEKGRKAEIDQTFHRFCIIELSIEHMTGKVAKELI